MQLSCVQKSRELSIQFRVNLINLLQIESIQCIFTIAQSAKHATTSRKKIGYELQLHSMDKKNEIEIYHEEKKNDLPFPCKLTVNLIITRLDYFLCTSIVMCAHSRSLSLFFFSPNMQHIHLKTCIYFSHTNWIGF